MKIKWRQPTIKEGITLAAVAAAIFGLWQISPPRAFPLERVVSVPRGADLAAISAELAAQKVIQSPRLFRLLVATLRRDRRVLAGYYQFEKPLPLLAVTRRLLAGQNAIEPVKFTLVEGQTNEQFAATLERAGLPEFNREEFLTQARGWQGYLASDTYLVPSHITARQLLNLLQDRFVDKLRPLAVELGRLPRSLHEIITLASVVEREASDEADRRQIAAILWQRYDDEMKLQVDVARETYRALGLPAEPIDNPGVAAIAATLAGAATSTPYWFYLSDSSGVTYYAETYAEHKKNINRYLK